MENKPPRKAKPGHHWVEVYGRGPNNHYWYEAEDPPEEFYFGIYEEVLPDGTIVEHKIKHAKFNKEPQILNDEWIINLRGKNGKS